MMGTKCRVWVWVKLLVLIMLFMSVENCLSDESTIRCWEEERLALLQLKHFINDPYSLQKWVGNSDSDCCLWEEVKCSNATGRVIELYLSQTMILGFAGGGYLNASLFSPFQELECLDLSHNNIAGFVEGQGLEKLSKLKILNLGNNLLNNSILSSLRGLSSSLRQLHLYNNNLDGTIHLKGLSKLEFLDLSGNTFQDRSFLSSLTRFSSLTTLNISGIGLEGTFHVQELGSLSNVEELDMSFNAIDKFVVPTDYRGLRKLNSLNLDAVGEITDGSTLLHSIGSLTSLKTLSLGSNDFTGLNLTLIPTDMHNFTNLEDLTLDDSTLHISLLQTVAAFNSLKRLSMRICQINGISNLQGFFPFKNLEYLDIAGTTLNGHFHQLSRLMTSLKILYLSNCELKGTLSDQGLCELVHLQELYIDNNDLRGILPWCLSNMISLRVLDVSYNQLIGKIPWCLGNLTSLRVLDVSRNQLIGKIPWCLRNFTSLQALDVSSNHLIGNISSSPLIYLTSIQHLTLSNNYFQIPISLGLFYNHSNLMSFYGENNNQVFVETNESQHSMTPKFQLSYLRLPGHGDGGMIPEFLYHQHELVEVDLSYNNLNGEFPNWLFENNTKLQQLLLVNNSFSGPFHMPSNPHSKLRRIDISNNFITGYIPVEIGEFLPTLRYLNLSINAINGCIPSSFGNMKSLKSLDLSSNQLTGGIPEYLAMGCFSLELLVLSDNNLQGHIFSKTCNLRNLMGLQLDGNHFTGEIPECLSNLTFLRGLYFSDNHLLGRIPGWLGDLSYLRDIMMSNNHFEGPIPTEFCQLISLEILDLSENNLSGSLPSCLGPPYLEQVHLSKNMLQGQLKDSSFGNSFSLVTLDLSYNLLFGSIPNWIGRLSQLTYLIMGNNNLEGEVSVELCQLNQLRLIDFSHNNLSGQIPSCLDNTTLHKGYYVAAAPISKYSPMFYYQGPPIKKENIKFTTKKISYSYQGRPLADMFGVDLSCNKLIGEIPPQIGNLTMVRALNLSHNNLMGSIPMTFSNLQQIESLDLSYNELNGKIPPELVKLNALAVFSVAHNNLTGEIPDWTAQFSTFNESSYDENPFLCGLPLPKSCNENGSPPSTPKDSNANQEEEDNKLIDMDSFYITFTVSYGIVFLGFFTVLYVNPSWRRRWFYLVETLMTSCYYFVVDHLSP